MIPKRAIKKAIEGGWTWEKHKEYGLNLPTEVIALDPTFWQALGKSLGWDESPGPKKWKETVWRYMGQSRENAHRFYDLILTGGDTKKFWDELFPTTTL